MDCLLSESLNKALLDSGCTKTVCGEEWLNCYMESLTENELKKVSVEKSDSLFKFGNNKLIKSKRRVNIPCLIGNRNVTLACDVVDCQIPLLLSKESMKKANTQIDFKSDTVQMFGSSIKLSFTSSGHYCISLNDCSDNSMIQSALLAFSNDKSAAEKLKMAKKIHCQFSHAPGHKIKALLNDAGV